MANQPNKQPKPTLAAALYPSLTAQAKAQKEEAQRRRDKLLRDLRELNGRLEKSR
jgi:hypothetical protein